MEFLRSRGFEALSGERQKTANMDIYLLRHGETDWNKERLLQGHTDTLLNEKGKRQVEETAQKLADLGVSMDAIVTSPLKRARESAAIAACALGFPQEKIVVEELLIERGFGEGEGMLLEEMKARYPNRDCPGMESREELVARAGLALQKITETFADAERILLAAHGAILFALLEAAAEKPIPYQGRAACLRQGSIYRIRHENGKNTFACCEEGQETFVELDEVGLGKTAKIYL